MEDEVRFGILKHGIQPFGSAVGYSLSLESPWNFSLFQLYRACEWVSGLVPTLLMNAKIQSSMMIEHFFPILLSRLYGKS